MVSAGVTGAVRAPQAQQYAGAESSEQPKIG
jgi:hypothetical protein